MDLLALVMGLFDPAGRYMREHRHGHAAPFRNIPLTPSPQSFVEGAVLGPDVPGGARQATAEELASMRQRAQQYGDRHQAALERARSRWNRQALICARELLDSGTTVLSAGSGTVRGHLVRFWRGDSVLELSSSNGDERNYGSFMARVGRRRHHMSADMIADYLIQQVAQLESRPEPS